jgi:peptidoglycan/xylan/chitin deacetylase (PgdA/CDA1 family)
MIGRALGAVACAAAAAWAVRGRSSPFFGGGIWRGPAGSGPIALTFDDGPTPGTEALLDLLDAQGVKATFFVCGEQARRQPRLLRRLVDSGHELGNHTATHARLWLLPPAQVYAEVARAQHLISDIGGVAPRWFRPPYGVRWFGLARALRDLHLQTVMWTVSALDWKLPPEAIVRRLEPHLRPGVILCLHDGRQLHPNPDISATLAAVKRLLSLAELRTGFATLTQLLNDPHGQMQPSASENGSAWCRSVFIP